MAASLDGWHDLQTWFSLKSLFTDGLTAIKHRSAFFDNLSSFFSKIQQSKVTMKVTTAECWKTAKQNFNFNRML